MLFFPVFAKLQPASASWLAPLSALPIPTSITFEPSNLQLCNLIRMNTCKSVSKQMTLTPFRMNTYEKHRGEGGLSVFLTKDFVLTLESLIARSHTLFARSFHSFTKECLRTPLRPTRSTLFFKTAGCICISNQILKQELVEDSPLPRIAESGLVGEISTRPKNTSPSLFRVTGHRSGQQDTGHWSRITHQPYALRGNGFDPACFSSYHDRCAWLRNAASGNEQPMKTKSFCLTLCCLLPLAAAAQTPDYIVDKVLAARGTLDKIHAVQAERVSGHISFGPDAEGPFVVELKRPRKMHMEFTIQGSTLVRVYDGKSAGWANNPFAGKNNPEPMTEEDLKNISEESDFDGPLVDYKAKGNQIELVGKDKVEGKEVYRLKLTTKNGDVRFYLFDSETFLLLKWEGKRKYKDEELPVQSFFRDYRDVGGLQFAFEIDSGASAEEINQKILIDKIEIDPEISDSRFAKPLASVVPAPSAPPPRSQNSAHGSASWSASRLFADQFFADLREECR
jgi:outer membrane lipoprotein-sorting protein